MRPDTLPLDSIRGARVLHVSGISQAISASACDAVFAAIDAAKARRQRGSPTIPISALSCGRSRAPAR